MAARHKAIVVDFHATWCGPCRKVGPQITRKCEEAGVTLVKVDVDWNQEASEKYDIKAMPTFKVLDTQGNIIFEKVGGTMDVVNEVVQFAASKK